MRYTILTLTIQQNTLCLDGTEIWYMPEIVLSLRESRSQKRTKYIYEIFTMIRIFQFYYINVQNVYFKTIRVMVS